MNGKNQYVRGQVVGYFGNPVTIQSVQVRSDDGFMYMVEATDGSFLRARHENLRPTRAVATQPADKSLPFEVVASRAAGIRQPSKRR